MKRKNKIKVLSLFSGCGGLDLGFIGGFKVRNLSLPRTQFDIVFANDFDSNAVEVYNQNQSFFGKHKCVLRDVKEIKCDELPPFDVLLAGFPCQPFSNAGNREGVNDKHGRGTLFYECERIIAHAVKSNPLDKRPLLYVFENVRGILSSYSSKGVSVPEEIRKRMKKLGYNTYYQLVKASDYGVPQNRYRVIMIGVREDLPEFDFDIFNQVVEDYKLPSDKKDPYDLLLGSVLSDLTSNHANFNDYWPYSPSGQKMIENVGLCTDGKDALALFKKRTPLEKISKTITIGRSWKNIPVSEMTTRFRKIFENPEKYRAPNFYRRFALGEICGTITASGQPENSGITHPFEHRRFSVREIARIQSFPDNFTFNTSSIPNAYKVIGNAVPPVLGWVIAKGVEKYLTKNYYDKN